MTASIQVFSQHSTLLGCLSIILLFTASHGNTVYLDYPSNLVEGHGMPEEINVTVKRESNPPVSVHLKRSHLVSSNVPVYTLGVDKYGKYVYKKEQLVDTKDRGYYQDVKSEAAFEIFNTGEVEQNKSKLSLKGEMRIDGKKYMLERDLRIKRDASRADGIAYTLLPRDSPSINAHDYIVPPPEKGRQVTALEPQFPGILDESNTSVSSIRNRRQSQSVQTIYIDVAAVADYAVYQKFLSSSGTRTATLKAMREYFSFIFNGVDLRYQGITNSRYAYRVRLIKLIIAESSAASTFTENHRVVSTPRDQIDAQDSLNDFSTFVDGSGRNMIFPCDHATLFTGFDLVSKTSSGGVSDATAGLAFTSTLCRTDGKSTSIVEERGGFQSVDTVTHEIGHSMFSLHDGDNNGCRSSDRYIMSAGGYPETESNKLNPWIFSSCSVTAFTNFVSSKLSIPSYRDCLLQQLTISDSIPDVSSRLPGQEYSPDAQCRMIFGNFSRLCRGSEFGTPADICTSMFCFDPKSSGTCYQQKASMGTSCGNGKMCLNGQCVPDSRAPVVDDECVFGDQPGVAFEGQTCSEFVGKYSGYCYQEVVKTRCCASCQKVYKRITGCEYGDKVLGCRPSACSRSAKSCCGTCNYGTPMEPAQSQASVLGIRSSPVTVGPVTVKRTTQATVQISTARASCVDDPRVLVSGRTCSSAIRLSFFYCYMPSVRIACCFSCQQANARLRV